MRWNRGDAGAQRADGLGGSEALRSRVGGRRGQHARQREAGGQRTCFGDRRGQRRRGGQARPDAGVESGAFASSGLDVSITPFTDTVQIMVSIAGGQLEMGQITLGVGALNAMARGTDLKLVASANQDPAEHGALTPLLIRTDLIDSGQVKSVKDLKGRKLAINGKGTILEYTIGKLMLGAGLQPSDVDVVVLPLPDQVTALGNKAIDASLTLQPLATQAVQKGLTPLRRTPS